MEFTQQQIEGLEHKYLEEFYHFLKFVERRMLQGFKTKEKIKDNWISQWQKEGESKGISSFSTGAERIIYALFNAQGFGQPNSAPIGSDLFFETGDAFIHIDLKTVQTRNIGDYNTSIFVGSNQNSYAGEINVKGKEIRKYNPALPSIYNNSGDSKPCLSYFITILYDEDNLAILNVNIICMPNGLLREIYGKEVLKAGKTTSEVRFNFSRIPEFRLLENNPKRIKVVYFNENMKKEYKEKLEFIEGIYKIQKD